MMRLLTIALCGLLAAATSLPASLGRAATDAPPQDQPDRPVAARPDLSQGKGPLAINPANGMRLVTILYPTTAFELDSPCPVHRSVDGGRTWTHVGSLPLVTGARCAGFALRYAPDGNRLYAVTAEQGWNDLTGNLVVSTSLDDGLTWSGHVALASSSDYAQYGDLSLAVPLRDGNLDELWLGMLGSHGDSLSVLFAGSIDAGATWGVPTVLQHITTGVASFEWLSHVRVGGGRGRALLVAWTATTADPAGGAHEEVRVAASADGGATFEPFGIAASHAQGFAPEIVMGPRGVAHVVYAGGDGSGPDYSDIFYTWSKPPYQQWSEPLKLGSAEGSVTELSPSLAIQLCGMASILHVIWQDDRLSPPDFFSNDYWNIFYTRKLAWPGHDWSTPIRISSRSTVMGYGNGGLMDSALAVGTGASRRVYAAWTDARDQRPTRFEDADVYGSNILSGITCP